MTSAVIELASSPRQIAARVFARFAWSTPTANRLAYQIATIRTGGYDSRLKELSQQIGVRHPASLQDAVVMDQIVQDSRGVAFGVLRTYNRDLKAFIAAQDKGLTQAALSRAVSDWQRQRAEWKTLQIAKTELAEGRSLALADVLSKNGLVLLQRASPAGAGCPICKAIVARGWLRPDQIDFHLPAHPACVHVLEAADTIASQAASKDRLWLGQWARAARGQAAA